LDDWESDIKYEQVPVDDDFSQPGVYNLFLSYHCLLWFTLLFL